MWRATFTKLGQTLLVLLLVSIASFAFLKLAPGDPVTIMLGSDYSKASYDQLTQELGLNEPVIVQYGLWLKGASKNPTHATQYPVKFDSSDHHLFCFL